MGVIQRCVNCGHPRSMHNGKTATMIFGRVCPGWKGMQMPDELSERVERLEQAVLTLTGWLTQVPDCLGQQDYRAMCELLPVDAPAEGCGS